MGEHLRVDRTQHVEWDTAAGERASLRLSLLTRPVAWGGIRWEASDGRVEGHGRRRACTRAQEAVMWMMARRWG